MGQESGQTSGHGGAAVQQGWRTSATTKKREAKRCHARGGRNTSAFQETNLFHHGPSQLQTKQTRSNQTTTESSNPSNKPNQTRTTKINPITNAAGESTRNAHTKTKQHNRTTSQPYFLMVVQDLPLFLTHQQKWKAACKQGVHEKDPVKKTTASVQRGAQTPPSIKATPQGRIPQRTGLDHQPDRVAFGNQARLTD